MAEQAGAKTQVTGLVGALAITLMLLIAPGLLRNLPQPTLAAVVIAAAITLAVRRPGARYPVEPCALPVGDAAKESHQALASVPTAACLQIIIRELWQLTATDPGTESRSSRSEVRPPGRDIADQT